MRVFVYGRPGSVYRRKIKQWLGNVRLADAQVALNYGLQGEKLENYIARFPRVAGLPTINSHQFGNKFQCVRAASLMRGAPIAPKSFTKQEAREGDWINPEKKYIAKPFYSLGGRDINRIENIDDVNGRTHYIQEEITNRRYELRCHAAAWISPKKWLFQKRVHEGGEDVLAWNHHNGGRFVTVENPVEPLFDRVRITVIELMRLFNYGFGAADFIIQNPGRRNTPLKHFFIEWNLAPGWTIENTEAWYESTMKGIQELDLEMFECVEHGLVIGENIENDQRVERRAQELVEEEVPLNFFDEMDDEFEDDVDDFPQIDVDTLPHLIPRGDNIGYVLGYGIVFNDTYFEDRCPECGYSYFRRHDAANIELHCNLCGTQWSLAQ